MDNSNRTVEELRCPTMFPHLLYGLSLPAVSLNHFYCSHSYLENHPRSTSIFFCSQLFEIYDALPDPSISRMNEIVRGAVNLCTGSYITVGLFGYIVFYQKEALSGNVLTEFQNSPLIIVFKLGFVLSVAVSFPLVIFPCRTSIHSLLFRKVCLAHNVTRYLRSEFIF